MNQPCSRLIVALDVPDRIAAIEAVDRLAGRVGLFKVGLELFVREGPRLVEEILGRGEGVFLDLKLHDIPNTVAGAVRSACRLGIQMLTVHAAGGRKMLEAARLAAETAERMPLILAVTALTSLAPEDIAEIGIQDSTARWVERLARLALEAGLTGLVASPLELPQLRRNLGSHIKLVVPGIRPLDAAAQDQARTAQPGDAIKAGADYLVIGRPILQAPDPVAATELITAQMTSALGSGRL